MAAPASSQKQFQPPAGSPQGTYMVSCTSGAIAIIGFDGTNWMWGSLTPCTVTNYRHLGTNIINVSVATVMAAARALLATPKQLLTLQKDFLDHIAPSGNPAMILPDGTAKNVPFSSTAQPTTAPFLNSAANALSSIGSGLAGAVGAIVNVIKALFSGALWKGIGLIVAGGLLLVFAALELKKAI